MGISSITNRVSFTGDGSSTIFSFPYEFFSQNDLKVYLFDTGSGIVYSQLLNTNYSVAGALNQAGIYPLGGNVVMASAFPSNLELIISRGPLPINQFSLSQNGPIPSAGLNTQLDYLTALIQKIHEKTQRSVAIPDGVGTVNGSGFNPQLPASIIIAALSANAPLVVNSGANGWSLGLVATGQSGSVSYIGTLPVINGGTGQNNPLIPNELLFAFSSSVVGQINAGAPGSVLTSSGSSAPSFQPVSILSGSGVLPLINGGTGNGTFTGGHLTFATSSAISESQILLVNSSQIQLGAGNSSAPAWSFLLETNTGYFRNAATDIVFQVAGNYAAEYILSGTNVNIGYGPTGTASAALSNPFSLASNFNGKQFWQFYNSNTGNSSVTSVQVLNGSPSQNNATSIENWANNTLDPYLGGASVVSATLFQTALVLVNTNPTGAIRLTVGGLTQANEVARINPNNLTLNQGKQFILTGSGGTITLSASSPLSSYQVTLPTAQGGVGTTLVNNGSGQLSWASPVGISTNFSQIVTTINTSNYVFIGSTTFLVSLGTIGTTVSLPNPTTNVGQFITLFNGVSASSAVTVTCSNGQIYGGPSTLLAASNFNINAYQQVQLLAANTQWLITDFKFAQSSIKWMAASLALTANYSPLTWKSLSYDNNTLMSGSSGVVTINQTGRWSVNCSLEVGNTSIVAGASSAIAIFRNNLIVSENAFEDGTGTNMGTLTISDVVLFNQSDSVTVKALSGDNTPIILGGSHASFITFAYLGP